LWRGVSCCKRLRERMYRQQELRGVQGGQGSTKKQMYLKFVQLTVWD
jgi:hypothetical protein